MVELLIPESSRRLRNSLEQKLIRIVECGILPKETYLAGGTAVYLYLPHRLSMDLDFFTPTPFSSELFLNDMRGCFDAVTVELLGNDTAIFYLGAERLKFSLFRFPYRLLCQLNEVPIQERVACPLASLDDISAMKAVAINQRGSMKDFIDLFFILRETGMNFSSMEKAVRQKYELDEGYDYQLKISLVYFDDAEKEMDQIVMLKDDRPTKMTVADWETIKAFYMDFVK
jgi:hypothetical protein